MPRGVYPRKEITRKRISESTKGKKKGPMSEETKQKLRDIFKNKKMPPRSEEHRKNISIAQKNQSEETRLKRRLAQLGEKGSNWRGGISFEPYCVKFNREFKERVRAFFEYQCQECGHVWKEGEIKLSVHHVNFNKKTCCDNSVPLFVPLCVKCHPKTNNNREFWEYWFTEMINRIYNGQCYIKK